MQVLVIMLCCIKALSTVKFTSLKKAAFEYSLLYICMMISSYKRKDKFKDIYYGK